MARRRDPAFFKVLLGDDYSQKLRIPGAFLKYFDGEIPKQFRLRTPTGTWLVDVVNVGHKFYIQKGWEEFVRENGVRVREYVVFRYTEISEFSVDIYGINTCKKLFVMASKEQADEEEDDDPSVEILGDDENEFEEERRQSDEEDVGYGDEDESENTEEATENEDEDHKDDDSDDSSVEIIGEFPSYSKTTSSNANKAQRNIKQNVGGDQGGSSTAKCEEIIQKGLHLQTTKINTLHRAYEFAAKSAHPNCVIPMTRTYANGNYLNIPSDFANSYLMMKKPIHAIFGANGRRWPVKISQYSISQNYNQVRVIGGWYKFARCIGLKENDVLVCVLTNSIKLIFDVKIFRINEAANSLPGRNKKHTATAQQKSEKHTTMNGGTGRSSSHICCSDPLPF